MRGRRWKKLLLGVMAAVVVLWTGLYVLQRFWAHRGDAFASGPETVCAPLLGWFTREDRLVTPGPPLTDAQPGDILVTLSTHSVGWRHGHAGLVIDGDTVLECMSLGYVSRLVDIGHWSSYSDYALLRLKDVTPEQQAEIAEFAIDHLTGVPYRLTAGLWGEKRMDPGSAGFGLNCTYLVWYAYASFGYDLDSDGGRIVSASDLLGSNLLETVQVYGLTPGKYP